MDDVTQSQVQDTSPAPEQSQSEDAPSTETVQAAPPQPKEDVRESNLRALRKEKERLAQERDEALRRLAAYESQKSPQPSQEEDLDFRMAPEELVEGKHLSKVDKKIKKLEEQLKQYQQQSATSVAEAKLKVLYPDFDAVVSQANVEALRAAYPELAQTLNASSDIYSKAVSAYTLIKKLGIQTEDTYQQDRELAQKNAAKPRPLASVSPQQGNTPLSQANAFANGFTKKEQEALWAEMQATMKKTW